MADSALDRWIPRVGMAAMVCLALLLVGTGFALYGPKSTPIAAQTATR